jgi:acyl-CoA thioesterase FadM
MSGPVLTLRLTTRGYELAQNGVIPVSMFLRYLEHQRWQTMTREGALPMRRYWTLGVVRAQHLELLDTVTFHEELELSLWVSRVGRTSLDFSHDIVRVATGAVVARSSATIVALDASRHPTTIKPEARELVVERQLGSFAPPAGERPADVWEHPVHLRPSDHDLQRHVNHARYADLLDDVRVTCASAGGYGEGFGGERPIRAFSVSYDSEARAGDDMVGRTWRVDGSPTDVEIELAKVGGPTTTRARVRLAS